MDVPGPAGGDATRIAEVVFAAEDARVILAVDASLAGDTAVADELTDMAVHAATPADLAEDVRDVAEAMDLGLSTERRGATDILTLHDA